MGKKKLQFLVVHCTATNPYNIVTVEDIKKWHLGPLDIEGGKVIYKGRTYPNREALPNEYIRGISIKKLKGRGWTRLGYSDIIFQNGVLYNITPYNEDEWVDEWEITNGVSGINSISRHIVYVGGINSKGQPKDTRTYEQLKTMEKYVRDFIIHHPEAKIAGHNQFANKACPSFNVPEWLKYIAIDSKYIYMP